MRQGTLQDLKTDIQSPPPSDQGLHTQEETHPQFICKTVRFVPQGKAVCEIPGPHPLEFLHQNCSRRDPVAIPISVDSDILTPLYRLLYPLDSIQRVQKEKWRVLEHDILFEKPNHILLLSSTPCQYRRREAVQSELLHQGGNKLRRAFLQLIFHNHNQSSKNPPSSTSNLPGHESERVRKR